ncbi:MmpS family transport accessory protein [Amycolatopsis sp. NPDC088138]|uniref:MmpS family transport accessory protein n=1 Tax=Amycolatopsis sp. NPDC088138 TaxID=3363938 RepID=UPI0037F1EBBF
MDERRFWPAITCVVLGMTAVTLALIAESAAQVTWAIACLVVVGGVAGLVLVRLRKASVQWVAIGLVAVAVAGCVWLEVSLRPVTIRYEVSGDAPYVADLEYVSEFGDYGDARHELVVSGVPVPWSFEVRATRSRDGVELVGRAPSGTLTCRVFVDGRLAKEAAGKTADCGGA